MHVTAVFKVYACWLLHWGLHLNGLNNCHTGSVHPGSPQTETSQGQTTDPEKNTQNDLAGLSGQIDSLRAMNMNTDTHSPTLNLLHQFTMFDISFWFPGAFGRCAFCLGHSDGLPYPSDVVPQGTRRL